MFKIDLLHPLFTLIFVESLWYRIHSYFRNKYISLYMHANFHTFPKQDHIQAALHWTFICILCFPTTWHKRMWPQESWLDRGQGCEMLSKLLVLHSPLRKFCGHMQGVCEVGLFLPNKLVPTSGKLAVSYVLPAWPHPSMRAISWGLWVPVSVFSS